MNTCARIAEVEKWFDTGGGPDDLQRHIADCGACAEHLRFLESTRTAMKRTAAAVAERPVNADRFLTDFRERVQDRPQRLGPRWGLVSAAAAALIVALSLLSIFTPEQGAVDARSYVDSAQTEIEGATAETYHSEDGTAIVWVNVPEGDMW